MSFIREAARSLEACRGFSTLTGAAALALVAKQNQPSYGRIGPGPYVPLLGEAIAELSRPSQVVPLLKALPADWSQLYSCESNLLRSPPPEQSQLDNLDRLAQKIGGSKTEYVKYFARDEVLPLWEFCVDGEHKASCSFKTVMKKNGVSQRKILPCLIANACFIDPPRKESLGLLGGANLVACLLGGDLWASAFDQENCFSYVEIPPWWRKWLACPRLRHHELGGPRRTGLWGVPARAWVRPCYKRLPMGSTHAVDLIFQVNWQLAGRSLNLVAGGISKRS